MLPEPDEPPVPISANYQQGPQVLRIVFSQPLDPDSPATAARFRLVSPEGSFTPPELDYELPATVRLSMSIPGPITSPATCSLIPPPDQLFGANGEPVAPFTTFGVTLI